MRIEGYSVEWRDKASDGWSPCLGIFRVYALAAKKYAKHYAALWHCKTRVVPSVLLTGADARPAKVKRKERVKS